MNTEKMFEKIDNLKLISSLYEDAPSARERYKRLVKSAADIFSDMASPVFISVPGRTEICGNHTDHQNGRVLASAVNLDTICLCEANGSDKIRIYSEGYGMSEVNLNELEKHDDEKGETVSLIRGIAAKMREKYNVSGFDAYFMSDVLSGSGLSSSASFEVAVSKIISVLFNEDKLLAVELAKISQYAENVYFGKPCGLMDQMACAVGGLIYIDFNDKENPVYEKLSLDLNGYTLAIVDTKASHADLTDEYAAIPAEMSLVASFFDKTKLAEVSYERFKKNIGRLKTALKNDRAILRAYHFFKEQERVLNLKCAAEAGRINDVFDILNDSGKSSLEFLQNVYTNKKTCEQPLTLGYALLPEVMGCPHALRVHGGGFAGTLLAILKKENAHEFKETAEQIYSKGSVVFLSLRDEGAVALK